MKTTVIDGGTTRGWLDDAAAGVIAEKRRGKEEAEPTPTRIGVVFVHGIGSQRPGETLLSWSRSLLRVVGAWSARQGGPYQVVSRASLDLAGESIPYVEMTLPRAGGHPEQTWVLTEAYWAAQIRPPTIAEMTDWLVGRWVGLRLIWSLGRGIGASFGFRLASGLDRLALFLPAVGLYLVAVLLFILSRILAWVPIRALQHNLIVRSFDYFLGDWFGDVRILLADRVQAANIRSQVRRSIHTLRDYGCEHVVLIGHSGGTFVSYMTLAEPGEDKLPVDRLITHGQALSLAWFLGNGCSAEPDVDDEDALQVGDPLRADLAASRPNLTWHDFHATHDPAPMGGFEHAPCVPFQPGAPGGSILVHNRASFVEDHGAYWENIEEFVLPVARLLETTSPASPVSRFYDEATMSAGMARRRSRVRHLSLARITVTWSALVGILVVGPLGSTADALLGRTGAVAESIGRDLYAELAQLLAPVADGARALLGLDLPQSLPGSGNGALGLLAVIALYLLCSRMLGWVWVGWDQRFQRRFLAPPASWPSQAPLSAAVALCGVSAVALVPFAASGAWAVAGVAMALLGAAIVMRLLSGVMIRSDG